MTIIDDRFDEKYGTLPEEVRLYFSSESSGEVILALAREYRIKADDVYKLVFTIVNSGFNLDVLHEKINKLDLTGIESRRFWSDFLGRLILPIMPYVENKDYSETSIYNEIKKAGGNPENYRTWAESVDNIIEEANGEAMDELISGFEESVDKKEERDYVTDLLSDSIVEILKTKSVSASIALNSGLIYLLFNAEGFREEAAKLILSSKELIGKKNIAIDGKELAPTIANWIKDFIKTNGSDMFADVILAQYLDTSLNVAKLKEEEKDILSGVLHFYNNIAYFPESMSNIAPEDWRIFPFAIPEKNILKNISRSQDMIDSKSESGPKKEQADYVNDSEKDFLAGISLLMEARKNYNPDSLEYKAIEEEIRRLKVKKD